MQDKTQTLSNALQIVKPTELTALRTKLHSEQNNICPLLGIELPLEDIVIDHQHRKNQQQPIGEEGAGLIRGAIQRQANALEGKITNNWRRYNMDRFEVPLPVFLRNLADYLERENTNLIHPSELPKIPILKKSSYNQLVKAVNGQQKVPPYRIVNDKPKQKMTKPLKALFEKYDIKYEFY